MIPVNPRNIFDTINHKLIICKSLPLVSRKIFLNAFDPIFQADNSLKPQTNFPILLKFLVGITRIYTWSIAIPDLHHGDTSGDKT